MQHKRLSNSTDATIRRKKRTEFLPPALRASLERLSGFDLSDVIVHYNCDQPKRLGAKAFAQGNAIYLGHDQEEHIAHEAWHVIQQRQGRVAPTHRHAGTWLINDDPELEREADLMGALALNPETRHIPRPTFFDRVSNLHAFGSVIQCVPDTAPNRMKLDHPKHTIETISVMKISPITFKGEQYIKDDRWIFQEAWSTSRRKQIKDLGKIAYQGGMTVGGAFAPGIEGQAAGRTELAVGQRSKSGFSHTLAPGRITMSAILARLTIGKEPAEVTAMKESMCAPKNYIGVRRLSRADGSVLWLSYSTTAMQERLQNAIGLGHAQSALTYMDQEDGAWEY